MSRYAKFLDKFIDKSGLTLAEIAERCFKNGVKITSSYLSKLRNGKMPPPSYKVSAALAAVLNIEPEELLALSKLDESDLKGDELLEALMQFYPDLEPLEVSKKAIKVSQKYAEINYKETTEQVRDIYKNSGLDPDDAPKIDGFDYDYTEDQNLDPETIEVAKQIDALPEDKRKVIIDLIGLYKSHLENDSNN